MAALFVQARATNAATAGPRWAPSRSGLTLIELLAVLVLLGLVSTLAVPTLSRLSQRRADRMFAALRDLDSDTRRQARLDSRSIDLLEVLRTSGIPGETGAGTPPALSWKASDGHDLTSLIIDSRGRSADALLTLSVDGDVVEARLLGIADEWVRP
jgi:prepilin-type N-terminal cleavage/methylation domain-containing protein